jgi:hypothetical protein
MLLGELLVSEGLITVADMKAALQRQKVLGGRIGDSFIALGLVDRATLEAVVRKQYELGRAILERESAVAKAKHVYGNNHQRTNRERFYLAQALLAGGDAAEALAVAKAALAGHQESLGRDHQWTKDSAEVVAAAGDALDKLREAKERVIETTVDKATAELAGRGLSPDQRIVITILD